MIDMTKLIFEIDETNNEIPQLRVAYRVKVDIAGRSRRVLYLYLQFMHKNARELLIRSNRVYRYKPIPMNC